MKQYCRYCAHCFEGDGFGCCETATLYDSTCHTVIGNIYDNPELLRE